jgi:hypothetical protein
VFTGTSRQRNLATGGKGLKMGPFDDLDPRRLSFVQLLYVCTGIVVVQEEIENLTSRVGSPSPTDVLQALTSLDRELLGRVAWILAETVGEGDDATDVHAPHALIAMVADREMEPRMARALLVLAAASWETRELGVIATLVGSDSQESQAARWARSGALAVKQRRALFWALAGLWWKLLGDAGGWIKSEPGLGVSLVLTGCPPIPLPDEVRTLLLDWPGRGAADGAEKRQSDSKTEATPISTAAGAGGPRCASPVPGAWHLPARRSGRGRMLLVVLALALALAEIVAAFVVVARSAHYVPIEVPAPMSAGAASASVTVSSEPIGEVGPAAAVGRVGLVHPELLDSERLSSRATTRRRS